MPFMSILIGSSMGWLIVKENKLWRKHVIMLLVIVLLISHFVSIRSKIKLISNNGQYAEELSCKILPFLNKIPYNGKLILLNSTNDNIKYSIYLINEFSVFEYGTYWFNQISGRNDFTTRIVEQADFKDVDLSDEMNLILTIDRDNVIDYRELKFHP